MIQVITPTGDRPEAWALCQRWMGRQTYRGEIRWIVVDDGTNKSDDWLVMTPETAGCVEHHRLLPIEGNSQHRNMLYLLGLVDPELPVVIWEDDDYYAPTWLATVAEKLKAYDAVGQRRNRYYHARTGAVKKFRNINHASLCATAFKGLANHSEMRRQCSMKVPLIDLAFWKRAHNKRLFDSCEVVGIKGMPGRAGIAGGHDMWTDTPFDLREWIGDDAWHYRRFLERPKC